VSQRLLLLLSTLSLLGAAEDQTMVVVVRADTELETFLSRQRPTTPLQWPLEEREELLEPMAEIQSLAP
jgi:hypothetical protein